MAGGGWLQRSVGLSLKKAYELLNSQIDLTENGPQCASVQLPMCWHYRLCEGVVASENNVAPVLPTNPKPNPL